MKEQLDQFENELAELKDWDQKHGKLFEPSVIASRANLKDKLARYEELELKFRNLNFSAPRLFREQRRQIERKLYPNFAIRALFRLSKALLPDRKVFAYEKRILDNYKKIHAQVQESGFSISEAQLESKVRQGNREFSLPVSYFVSEKEKMDFELKFSKDVSGEYKMQGYHARYQSFGENGQSRTCTFNKDESMDISARQSYNLLAGRSVCTGHGYGKDHWMQLDLNDKDAAGNFRTKVFPAEYGFDLSKSISDLGLVETLNFSAKTAIMYDLRQGERIAVINEKGKQIELEANPHKQRLDIYEKGVLKSGVDRNAHDGFKETRQATMKVVKPAKAKGI